jgi:hypothetical protein
VEEVRAQVARIVGQGDEVTTGQIPFTPRAKKVLELALREALSLDHNYIGPEHILLGLVRESNGVAARILLNLDAGPERIFERMEQLLSRPVSHELLPRTEWIGYGPMPRVLASGQPGQQLLLTGWLLFAAALGVGLLVGWAIWGH